MSQRKQTSNATTIGFVVLLSLVCAVVLSALASALREPQEVARELYRSTQMLVAARIFNQTTGTFQIENEDGEYVPADAQEDGRLVPANGKAKFPTNNEILAVYRARIRTMLVDSKGELTTFEKAGIDETNYLSRYRKQGYYKPPEKLLYKILPNPTSEKNEKDNSQAVGWVIPVNGFGLWDAIYGYLAIKPDGVTVIGISWYEQKETPGLGANISEASWQSQFPGKKIFQPNASGEIDPDTAPIGITVVRGEVAQVYGDSPKAENAVDGMSGATLTGNGVTQAYHDVLQAYRPFIVDLAEDDESSDQKVQSSREG